MPIQMLSILENLNNADEYTLLDGDISATVQPFFDVIQECPLSPLLFSIYWNDIDSVTDGAQGFYGAVFWWPFPPFQWTRGFADDAKQAEESMRWKEFSPCQHTEVIGSHLSNSENLPPLYFDGVLLPYTDSFKYLGMVCDKQINLNTADDTTLCPFTAGAPRVCSETT